MPTSTFDDLMTATAIPALETVFGIAAVHTNAYYTTANVTIMMSQGLQPVGEFGELMEMRTTIEIAKSNNVSVGDAFTITNDDGSTTVWRTTQLMTDDNYLQKYAVRLEA